jgi:hypothetical protein
VGRLAPLQPHSPHGVSRPPSNPLPPCLAPPAQIPKPDGGHKVVSWGSDPASWPVMLFDTGAYGSAEVPKDVVKDFKEYFDATKKAVRAKGHNPGGARRRLLWPRPRGARRRGGCPLGAAVLSSRAAGALGLSFSTKAAHHPSARPPLPHPQLPDKVRNSIKACADAGKVCGSNFDAGSGNGPPDYVCEQIDLAEAGMSASKAANTLLSLYPDVSWRQGGSGTGWGRALPLGWAGAVGAGRYVWGAACGRGVGCLPTAGRSAPCPAVTAHCTLLPLARASCPSRCSAAQSTPSQRRRRSTCATAQRRPPSQSAPTYGRGTGGLAGGWGVSEGAAAGPSATGWPGPRLLQPAPRASDDAPPLGFCRRPRLCVNAHLAPLPRTHPCPHRPFRRFWYAAPFFDSRWVQFDVSAANATQFGTVSFSKQPSVTKCKF